jgi:hypothetical protein
LAVILAGAALAEAVTRMPARAVVQVAMAAIVRLRTTCRGRGARCVVTSGRARDDRRGWNRDARRDPDHPKPFSTGRWVRAVARFRTKCPYVLKRQRPTKKLEKNQRAPRATKRKNGRDCDEKLLGAFFPLVSSSSSELSPS